MTSYSFRNRVNRLTQSVRGGSIISGKRQQVVQPSIFEPTTFIIGSIEPFISENFVYKINIQSNDYPFLSGDYIRNNPSDYYFNSLDGDPLKKINQFVSGSAIGWNLRYGSSGNTLYFRNSSFNLEPNLWVPRPPKATLGTTITATNFTKDTEFQIYNSLFYETNTITNETNTLNEQDIFIENNTVYGYLSSTKFENLSSIVIITDSWFKDLNLSSFKFANLLNLFVGSTNKIKSIILPPTTNEAQIRITNNTDILNIETPVKLNAFNFELISNNLLSSVNCSNINTKKLVIVSNPNLTTITWPIYSNNITNLQWGSNNRIQQLQLPSLSSLEILGIEDNANLTDINFSS